MPTYEYGCKGGHVWDTMRRIADRAQPLPCPDCGKAGTLRFAPTSNLVIPMNSQTRFADVAPLGEDGKPYLSPGEVLRSGQYRPYDPKDRADSERKDRAERKAREAKAKKSALKRAHEIQQSPVRVRDARRRGVQLRSA